MLIYLSVLHKPLGLGYSGSPHPCFSLPFLEKKKKIRFLETNIKIKKKELILGGNLCHLTHSYNNAVQAGPVQSCVDNGGDQRKGAIF